MKDLPRVFANRIDENINKSQNLFYGSNRSIPKEKNINIDKKINDIFSDIHHVYKSKVRINTNNDTLEKTVVGKTKTSLITIEGDLIPINSILDIEKL